MPSDLDPADLDLSRQDLEFLRAIRDINNNPDEYDETDRGEKPANKASLRRATDLTTKQLEYRFGGTNTRGFEQSAKGLIRIHDAKIEGNEFGPKAVELTQFGLEVLEYEDTDSGSSGDDTEAIRQLRARVNEIENAELADDGAVDAGEIVAKLEQIETQLDEMASRVSTIEDRVATVETAVDGDWGAMSDDKAEVMARVEQMAPVLPFLWSELLGVSMLDIVEADDDSEIDVEEYQRQIVDKLDAVRDQQTGGETPQDGSPTATPSESTADDVTPTTPTSDDSVQAEASDVAVANDGGESGDVADQPSTEESGQMDLESVDDSGSEAAEGEATDASPPDVDEVESTNG